MFDSVCNLMIIIFEAMCCKLFFDTFLEHRENRKFISFGLLILFNYFYTFWDYLALHIIQKQILVAITLMFCMYLYVNAKINRVIIVSILFQGLLLAMDCITYIIYSTLFPNNDFMQQREIVQSLSIIVFGKVLLFLCIIAIRRKIWKGKAGILGETEWIKFLFFPIFTIIVTIAMFSYFGELQDKNQIITLFLIAFGLVAMNLFIFGIVNDIAKKNADLKEKEVFEIQGKEQLSKYQAIADSYEKQKEQAHEYANQMLCIRNLLQAGEYEELDHYVESISGKFQEVHNLINTNHAVINTIINAKYKEAGEKGIQFIFMINDLSGLQIEKDDLVIMLSNLLNNAIEACEKCKGIKRIKLKLVKEKKELIISVKNTFEETITVKNDRFITTKKNQAENHGIGIRNVIRAVERNGGYYNISYEGNEFYFAIFIPLG